MTSDQSIAALADQIESAIGPAADTGYKNGILCRAFILLAARQVVRRAATGKGITFEDLYEGADTAGRLLTVECLHLEGFLK